MSIKKTKKTRNKSSKNMSRMDFNTVPVDLSKADNEKPQRALVFQGEGSLGAYEAGVFAVLYNWVKKDINDGENIFDIIAGTSVGAINASIIISHFFENKEKERCCPDSLLKPGIATETINKANNNAIPFSKADSARN